MRLAGPDYIKLGLPKTATTYDVLVKLIVHILGPMDEEELYHILLLRVPPENAFDNFFFMDDAEEFISKEDKSTFEHDKDVAKKIKRVGSTLR